MSESAILEKRDHFPSTLDLEASVQEASKQRASDIYFARLKHPTTQAQIRALYAKSLSVKLGTTTADELLKKFNARIDNAWNITKLIPTMSADLSVYNRSEQRIYIGTRNGRYFKNPDKLHVVIAHEHGHYIRTGGRFDNTRANSREVIKAIGISHRIRENAFHTLIATLGLGTHMLIETALTGIPLITGSLWLSIVNRGPYMLRPWEIVERMAQLKNYYGMKSGKDVFTRAHLEYARKHYCKDVVDNNMKQFFRMITPKTEKQFLDAMNSQGI